MKLLKNRVITLQVYYSQEIVRSAGIYKKGGGYIWDSTTGEIRVHKQASNFGYIFIPTCQLPSRNTHEREDNALEEGEI